MLSKKTRYAMLAMAALAREYAHDNSGDTLSISRIAESEHIPQRMLEGILLTLKNKGLLLSTRGKMGGYTLSKRPEDISLLDIVVQFEGSVSMLSCVCNDIYKPCEFCKDEASCPIRSTFSGIYRHTVEVLRTTTLADLTAERQAETQPAAE